MQTSCSCRLPISQFSREALPGSLLTSRGLCTRSAFSLKQHSKRTFSISAEGLDSADKGTMADAAPGRGYPLRAPRAWTTALVTFGLLQLYLFVINDALVPEGIQIVLYAICKDKANAQALAGLVTLVHIGEGLVALVTCLQRRYALIPTLYYSLLSFLLGFPGLGLTLKLEKINRNRAAAKEE